MPRISFLVGTRGFEPPTTCTPCRYANQTALRPVLTGIFYPVPTFWSREKK
jgi:hypothetical protein